MGSRDSHARILHNEGLTAKLLTSRHWFVALVTIWPAALNAQCCEAAPALHVRTCGSRGAPLSCAREQGLYSCADDRTCAGSHWPEASMHLPEPAFLRRVDPGCPTKDHCWKASDASHGTRNVTEGVPPVWFVHVHCCVGREASHWPATRMLSYSSSVSESFLGCWTATRRPWMPSGSCQPEGRCGSPPAPGQAVSSASQPHLVDGDGVRIAQDGERHVVHGRDVVAEDKRGLRGGRALSLSIPAASRETSYAPS